MCQYKVCSGRSKLIANFLINYVILLRRHDCGYSSVENLPVRSLVACDVAYCAMREDNSSALSVFIFASDQRSFSLLNFKTAIARC